MSIDKCTECDVCVDTDEEPEAYDIENRCLCWTCRAEREMAADCSVRESE